jgi:hypothetical protein
LQGWAQACKSPIPKLLFLLGVAACCAPGGIRLVSEVRGFCVDAYFSNTPATSILLLYSLKLLQSMFSDVPRTPV